MNPQRAAQLSYLKNVLGIENLVTPEHVPAAQPSLWQEQWNRPCWLVVVGLKGELSSGPTGEMLGRMLAAMKIPQERVSWVEWNGAPSEQGRALLRERIAGVEPRAILVLGERKLLFEEGSAKQKHCLVTHSLGHLLRNPQDKKQVWGELQALVKVISSD